MAQAELGDQLDARVKTAWRLQATLGWSPPVLVALVFVAASVPAGMPVWMPLLTLGIVVACAVASITVIPEVRYRRWRYSVTEEEIRLREGLLVVTQTVIPMVRVQHVDTAQGPIMRALDLSDVQIWTAAGKHTIPALAEPHAAALRDRIATLARITDDGGL